LESRSLIVGSDGLLPKIEKAGFPFKPRNAVRLCEGEFYENQVGLVAVDNCFDFGLGDKPLTKRLATTSNMPKYSHCACLHNALEKKNITAWGAYAYITWRNPNLNGGLFSYHRVGVMLQTPTTWRFVEFGQRKISTGIQGTIAYNAGSGTNNIFLPISTGTHQYSMQYDPNSGKYWFYLDGANVYNINAGFSSGNAVIAGGEVAYGVEAMAHTKIYGLRYLKRKADGTFVYVSWNGHVDYSSYGDDPPYYNTNINLNSFYDDP